MSALQLSKSDFSFVLKNVNVVLILSSDLLVNLLGVGVGWVWITNISQYRLRFGFSLL
jgi:hypothetical protein